MPTKTIRNTRRTKKTKRTKKRTKKDNKKNRYGGAPSKKSSAKSSEKKEKLMELIIEKFKKAENNIELTNSTIEVYEYVSKHPEILKDEKTRLKLTLLLEDDSDDVEEQINLNEEQLAHDYVNARMRLERLISAKQNA